ncbi:MAG: hypothetical protein FJ303_18475 [Planctomycetes bacterium]|nr:hypothetical protein [Planctomycetota bacterium]
MILMCLGTAILAIGVALCALAEGARVPGVVLIAVGTSIGFWGWLRKIPSGWELIYTEDDGILWLVQDRNEPAVCVSKRNEDIRQVQLVLHQALRLIRPVHVF